MSKIRHSYSAMVYLRQCGIILTAWPEHPLSPEEVFVGIWAYLMFRK